MTESKKLQSNSAFQDLQQRSWNALEWQKIVHALADRAVLKATKLRLLSLTPTLTASERKRHSEMTHQISKLFQAQGAPPLPYFEVDEALSLARRDAFLTPVQLFEISVCLGVVESFLRFAQEQSQRTPVSYPDLIALLERLQPQPDIHRRLLQSVSADGEVLSSASPALASARSAVQTLKRKVNEALDDLVRVHFSNLSSATWMLRDGYYVLPVRSDCRGEVAGVYRGVSASGATVYIEPTLLAGLYQSLAQAEGTVQLEEARIVRELSHEIYCVSESLEIDFEILCGYDEACARGRFASDIQGCAPQFVLSPGDGRFHFRHASHPLFLLEGKRCVANDLSLRFKDSLNREVLPCVWVLSGPNAGGKTVAMRTVGLNVLLALAGLWVAAEECLLWEFDKILVNMGDQQSRQDDLSTFSAHLLQLKSILDVVDDKTLVLLDEGFVGTDPALGMAMARATLEHLASCGATTIITTHFSNLKSLSDEDGRFANASMEFEPQQLKPTYKLLANLPGQSYALELAERLDFNKEILQKSRVYWGEEPQRMERLIATLQRQKFQLHELIQNNEQRNHDLLQAIEEQKNQNKALEELKNTLVQTYRNKLEKRLNAFEHRLQIRERQYQKSLVTQVQNQKLDNVLPHVTENTKVTEKSLLEPQSVRTHPVSLSSFQELEKIKLTLQKNSAPEQDELERRAESFRSPKQMTSRSLMDEAMDSLQSLNLSYDNLHKDISRDINTLVDQAAVVVQSQQVHLQPRQKQDWRPGMLCKSHKFKETGEIIRAPDGKGIVECLFGKIKCKVHVDDLYSAEAKNRHQNQPQKNQSSKLTIRNIKNKKSNLHGGVLDPSIPEIISYKENNCDLRGMTVETALDALNQFLDLCYFKNMDYAVVIHGHGTEKVKLAVREYLKISSPYALKFRHGFASEGGDGVTVVVFTGYDNAKP